MNQAATERPEAAQSERTQSETNPPESRRLTDFAQVEAIYRTRLKFDFARSERRPLTAIRRAWKRDAYVCYGLFNGGALLGYAFFVREGGSLLLDYFAIDAGHRGTGLGSVFLRQLTVCLQEARCVVAEVEDPDSATDAEERHIRNRRLGFYLRNGCRETELTASVFGVAYRILELETGTAHTARELGDIYTAMYRITLPGVFFRTQFRLHPFKEPDEDAIQ